MKADIRPGKYVLAVSGGADSMVLLDLLAHKTGIELIVAHFNHGIRLDAADDEAFVEEKAQGYGLRFEAGQGRLGPDASEEKARDARYEYLFGLQEKYSARAVITAHHQDDLIETAFINILRGTGPRGLASMINNAKVVRPLLKVSKKQILAYAKSNNLMWREDSSNSDEKILRNYVRSRITPLLTDTQRLDIVKNIEKVAKNNTRIDDEIANLSQSISVEGLIDRSAYNTLPVSLQSQLAVYWLRQSKSPDYDSRTAERISLAIRTSKANKKVAVKDGIWLAVDKKTARLTNTV